MTNSNENQRSRLDRIEAIVEANSQAIAENRQEITELVRASSEQRASISQLQQSTAQLQQTTVGLQQSTAQLAQAAQAALSMSQNNRQSWQETEQLTRRNASAIARLEERMEQYIAEGREHREFIATQVEGIRVETRRILQHLFGENNE